MKSGVTSGNLDLIEEKIHFYRIYFLIYSRSSEDRQNAKKLILELNDKGLIGKFKKFKTEADLNKDGILSSIDEIISQLTIDLAQKQGKIDSLSKDIDASHKKSKQIVYAYSAELASKLRAPASASTPAPRATFVAAPR